MSPIGFIVCGPPGVGKSVHFKKMLSNAGIKKKVTLFDPDMRTEESADDRSRLNLEDVHVAIESGIDLGYVGTCGGKRLVDIVKRMHAKNYHVIVAVVYTTLPKALERIQKRTEQPVPEDVVKDLYSYFKKKAESYMKLDADIYLYNNETDFNLLLSKKKKKIVCRDGDSDFYFDVSRYCSGSS
jgi:predicted ABC-type ATPase